MGIIKIILLTVATGIADVTSAHDHYASDGIVPPRLPIVGLNYLKTKARELL
jgi:hypothetical protein